VKEKQSNAERVAELVSCFAIGLGVLTALVGTGYYVMHRNAPGSREMWQFGLLVGGEIALVIPALAFIFRCVSRRVRSERPLHIAEDFGRAP
jgi:hypothetical protein